MKPRRLVPRALGILRSVQEREHVRLGDIAEVVEDTVDLISDIGASEFRRPVEGQNIRAVEGIVSPQFGERCWSSPSARTTASTSYGTTTSSSVWCARNVAMSACCLNGETTSSESVMHSPSFEYGRTKPTSIRRNGYSERCAPKKQESSSGPSRRYLYGKLGLDQIRNVLLPSSAASRLADAVATRKWMDAVESMHEFWIHVGDESDRRPILNSPLIGLVESDDEDALGADDRASLDV